MKLLKKVGSAAIFTAASASAFAHPGHDHESIWSALIHAAFYGSLAAAAIMLTMVAAKKIKQRQSK